MKREKARQRKELSRKRLSKAAGNGDQEACRKIEATKKSDRKRSAKNYYTRKRKKSRVRGT